MEHRCECECSAVTVRVIMFVRLLGGMYWHVSANGLVRLAARIYCVLCATVCTRHLLVVLRRFTDAADFGLSYFKALIFLTLYLLNVTVNFVYAGEYFFNFINKLRELDRLFSSSPKNDIKYTILLFITLLSHNILSFGSVCVQLGALCLSGVTYVLSTTLVQFAIALSSFTKIMMFECLYHRIRLLRERFERELSIARRFEDGEIVVVQNLRSSMNIYKRSLETVQISYAPMKILIFLTTAAIIPKGLLLAFEFTNKVMKYTWLTILETILEFTIPFMPGVFVELINSEVDKIRLRVMKLLLVYRGVKTRNAVLDMLKFIERRPFKYTVLRILTVDISLVLTIIGLVTTYTIAMVQFAHIYD